ncbi:MAG: glycosyl hydrolase 53 family protein [Sphaerochaetaceae bacterium]|nr:glycosyl hydrolase 53 family protein [Sphaerochaetaceae bacterium]MDD3163481.1 glycosyl hydrolase 53 family protein [Sphaerochaetaceae bacterium]
MKIGADISTLSEVESLGGKFFCHGQRGDLIGILADCGFDSVRLRLWVDPYSESGQPYMGGTSDLKTVKELARRAMEHHMSILLDLHYSDFWCDPAKQFIPKKWSALGLDDLCLAVGDYTAGVLDSLHRDGIDPFAVQVGNEITNGMLWPIGKIAENGFDPVARLFEAGSTAVRGHSDSKVMLHLEQSGNKSLWTHFLDEFACRSIDYDIIGASYYPFWHGSMDEMLANMKSCCDRYDKPFMIVETAYPFTSNHFSESCKPPLSIQNEPDGSSYSEKKQAEFISELLEESIKVYNYRCLGVYYWEPGWLAVPGTSWASNAGLAYIEQDSAEMGNQWANQCLFDYCGQSLPALDAIKEFSRHWR